MVHEKRKSGDPDYDDKVPAGQHGGPLVLSPDGREVLITESNGPVDRFTGEHVPIEGPTAEDLDNRPAPGEVAEEPSSVQTYSVEDTPLAPEGEPIPAEKFLADQKAKQDEAAGRQSGDEQAAKQQAEATPVPVPAKKAAGRTK
jgi:hypothetical protein